MCTIFVRFWDAECFDESDTRCENLYRKFIAKVVGEKTHVDWMVNIPAQKNNILFCFSAFENTQFSFCEAKTLGYKLTTTLAIPCSELIADNFMELSWEMDRKKIPYNYNDSHFLMPFLSPYTHSELIPDVNSSDIRQCFCSQIITILLRECLPPGHKIKEQLLGVNSRLISPNKLFKIIREAQQLTTVPKGNEECERLLQSASLVSSKSVIYT
jgi:hypothetical protein